MRTRNYYTFIGMLAALLPVMMLRDYTPDNELRYLSIAEEALRRGTFFTFTLHGEIYADKPPLYLWIVMLCKVMFGNFQMLFLSLFSLIPAFITIKTMEVWTEGEASSIPWRNTSQVLMMSCGLFLGMAVVLRMDMLMTMFITLALRSFWIMYQQPDKHTRHAILFPIWIFMALFSKGPIGVLVPLGATAVFLTAKHSIRTFGRYWGWRTWGILLAGCALWFGMVYIEGGATYLDNLLFHQTVDRAVNSFHHEEPFYYYTISIWYSLAPWSPLIIGTILESLVRRRFHSDKQKFLLATVVFTCIMLSCISSKIAVYMLPAFPFLVYLAMSVLPSYRWNGWVAAGVAFPATVWMLALPALAVANHLHAMPGLNHPLFWAGAGLLTLSGIYGWVVIIKRHNLMLAIRIVAVGLMLALFTAGWALPAVNGSIGYGNLCRKGIEIAARHQLTDFAVWDIRRPESMDVYLGKQIIKTDPTTIASEQRHRLLLMMPAKKLHELPPYFKKKSVSIYTEGEYALVAIE